MKLSKHEAKYVSRLAENKKHEAKTGAGRRGRLPKAETELKKQERLWDLVNYFLGMYGGNKSQASMALGVDRAAFSKWCSKKANIPARIEDVILKLVEVENDNDSI